MRGSCDSEKSLVLRSACIYQISKGFNSTGHTGKSSGALFIIELLPVGIIPDNAVAGRWS